MKLNPDCIRDILISVEEQSDFHHETVYKKNDMQLERLSKYPHDEIIYHIHQCELSNFIYGVHYMDGGIHIDIHDLTPGGHEFLANIRNDHFFEKVKSIAGELGLHSLTDISSIALNCASMLIKAHFNLP